MILGYTITLVINSSFSGNKDGNSSLPPVLVNDWEREIVIHASILGLPLSVQTVMHYAMCVRAHIRIINNYL